MLRYSRDEVLDGGWRNWNVSKLGSMAMTGAMPYELAMRVYAALAKGNLWLFMDIYPWLWFVLEYFIEGAVGGADGPCSRPSCRSC